MKRLPDKQVMADGVKFYPESPSYESDHDKEKGVPSSDSKLQSIQFNKQRINQMLNSEEAFEKIQPVDVLEEKFKRKIDDLDQQEQ